MNAEEKCVVFLHTLLKMYKRHEIHWIERTISISEENRKSTIEKIVRSKQMMAKLKERGGSKSRIDEIHMRKLEEIVSQCGPLPEKLKAMIRKSEQMKRDAEECLVKTARGKVTDDKEFSRIRKTFVDMMSKRGGDFEKLKQAMILETERIISKCQIDITRMRDHLLPDFRAKKEQQLKNAPKEKTEDYLKLESFLNENISFLERSLAICEVTIIMIRQSQKTTLSAIDVYLRQQSGEIDIVADSEDVMDSGFNPSSYQVVSEIFKKYNIKAPGFGDDEEFDSRFLMNSEDVRYDSEEERLRRKFYTMVAAVKLYQHTYLRQRKRLHMENEQRLSEARALLASVVKKRESTENGPLEEAHLQWLEEHEIWLKGFIENLESVVNAFSKLVSRGEEPENEKIEENYDEQDMRKIKNAVVDLFRGSEDVETLKQTIISETDRIISELLPLSSTNTDVQITVNTCKIEQISLLKFYDVIAESEESGRVLKEMAQELETIEDSSDEVDASKELATFMACLFQNSEDVGVLTTLLRYQRDLENWPMLSVIIHHSALMQTRSFPSLIQRNEARVREMRDEISRVHAIRDELKKKGSRMTATEKALIETIRSDVWEWTKSIRYHESETARIRAFLANLGVDGYRFETNPCLLKLALQDYDVIVSRCKSEFSRFQKHFVPFLKNFETVRDTTSPADSDAQNQLVQVSDSLQLFRHLSYICDEFLKTWKEKRAAIRKENNVEDSEDSVGFENEDVKNPELEAVNHLNSVLDRQLKLSEASKDSEDLKKREESQNRDDESMRGRLNHQNSSFRKQFLKFIGGITVFFYGIYLVFVV